MICISFDCQDHVEQCPFYRFSIGRIVLEKLKFSEESGFAKRQLAGHWSGKQSYLKQGVIICKVADITILDEEQEIIEKKLNKSGPKTEPCGTPQTMSMPVTTF